MHRHADAALQQSKDNLVLLSQVRRELGLPLPEEIEASIKEQNAAALLEKEKSQVLKKVEQATGLSFREATEAPASNVLGFAVKGERNPYIASSALQNARLAVHVGIHEAIHVRHFERGIDELDVERHLTAWQREALESQIPILKQRGKSLKDVDLIEGIVESLACIKDGREESNIAYLKLDVPVARHLNKLTLEHTQKSLFTIFETGGKESVFSLLRELSVEILSSQANNT